MHCGAVLRHVNVSATAHCLYLPTHICFDGEVEQERERLGGDLLSGEVEEDIVVFRGARVCNVQNPLTVCVGGDAVYH